MSEQEDSPVSPFALNISDITTLTISSKTGEETTATKRPDGWQIKDTGAEPDAAKIQALLHQLGNAAFTRPATAPDFPRAPPFTLTCRTENGKKQTLRLGPRLKSFSTQLVKFAKTNRVYLINSDLSSLLGLKHSKTASADYALHPSTLYHVKRPVKQVAVEKPFATYTCTRLSKIAVPASERPESKDTEPIHEWEATADSENRAASVATLHRWAKHVATMPVQKPVSPQRFDQTPGRYKLKINEDSSKAVTVTATGATKGNKHHFVRLEEPRRSVPYRISNFTFGRLFPSGASFLKDVPEITLPIKQINGVMIVRNDKRFILAKEKSKDEWQMAKPDVPYEIYTPTPPPGAPTPPGGAKSKAETYIERFKSLQTRDFVNPKKDHCAQLIEETFAQPAAELKFYRDKGTSALKRLEISQKIPGSELRFIRSDSQIIVTSRSPEVFAPHIEFFFDPQKIEDFELTW